MSKLCVMKFGGSSVADYNAMQNSAKIIAKTPEHKVIVVSALAGVTRLLMSLSYRENTPQKRLEILQKIYTRHQDIFDQLQAPATTLRDDFNTLFETAQSIAEVIADVENPQLLDELLSLGERMSSLLFNQVLNEAGIPSTLFDARQVLKTNSCYGNAEPKLAETEALCVEHLLSLCKQCTVVTQGFIGSDMEGFTTTLGKESSDYSAAIFAESLAADNFSIWTDVSGVYTTDPKISAKAAVLPEISFDEAIELSAFGAKVLHPRTLYPALRKNIKFYVGSSKDPRFGTWVKKGSERAEPALHAITLRSNQVLLKIQNKGDFGAAALVSLCNIFSQHKINLDLIASNGYAAAVVINDAQSEWTKKSLLTENLLQELSGLWKVTAKRDLALITLIGHKINALGDVFKKAFAFLSEFGLCEIFDAQSATSCSFLIDAKNIDAKAVVASLHDELFAGFDPKHEDSNYWQR